MVEPQARKRGISVTFPRFDKPCFILADRTRVKQILVNLLSNAIKYNTAGVAVIVGCIPTSPRRVRFSFTDTASACAGQARAAVPAVQPPRAGRQRRRRHRHRTCGVQAAGRIDGRRHRRGKHGRRGQRVLDRLEPDGRTAAAAPRAARHRAAPDVAGERALRTLLYVEDNPANLMLVEDLIARRPICACCPQRTAISGIEIARAASPTSS